MLVLTYRAWCLLGLVALHVVLFFYFIYASWLPYPVWDFLDWVVSTSVWAAGDRSGYLLLPHEGHLLVISRVLSLVDVRGMHGTGLPFLAVALVLFVVLTVSLVTVVLAAKLPRELALSVLVLTIIAVTKAELSVLASMPAMGVFIHAAALAAISIVLADRRPIGAVVCAMLAAIGSAGGLLVWPALIWRVWRSQPQLVAIGVCLFGAAFCIAYMLLSSAGGQLEHEPRVIERIDYFLRFLGLPWSHAPHLALAGRFIGALMFISGSILVILNFRTERRIEQIGVALILFAFTVAAAAALARAEVAPERPMPVRYAIFASLCQVGILFVFVRFLWAASPKLVELASWCIVVLSLVQQPFVGIAAERQIALYRQSWEKFTNGEWSEDAHELVYPDRSVAEEKLKYLTDNRLFGVR